MSAAMGNFSIFSLLRVNFVVFNISHSIRFLGRQRGGKICIEVDLAFQTDNYNLG